MALAVKPMLEGAFGTTGVDVPMSKTYYEPLLAGLADWALCLKNASRSLRCGLGFGRVLGVLDLFRRARMACTGSVHEAWVREAIAWRMDVGLDGCPDVVCALDAWTLEWLSQSEEVHVDVKTADWPFLAYVPELQTVLVQRLAWSIGNRPITSSGRGERCGAWRGEARVVERGTATCV